ncbi:MAG: hypothetical protein Q9168_003418 [Polycauliona sp. 1 TL-2023]
MAPLLKIFIQWLPTLPTISRPPSHGQANMQQQPPIAGTQHVHNKASKSLDLDSKQISSVSWGKNHLDVFGFNGENLTHKYWDGYQWNPSSLEMQQLGQGLAKKPVSISWGTDRLDIFGLDKEGTILHQYYDGTAWKPETTTFEKLGNGCDPSHDLAASTWGLGSLDVFCRDPKDSQILQQYYNDYLGEWSKLTPFGGDVKVGPRVWAEWEHLSGPDDAPIGHVSVASWSTDHFDIVTLGRDDGQYRYKYYAGSWQPSLSGWYDRPGVSFDSIPSVISWAPNRLDILGVTADDKLLHQAWTGYDWYPGPEKWETLSEKGAAEVESSIDGQQSIEIALR